MKTFTITHDTKSASSTDFILPLLNTCQLVRHEAGNAYLRRLKGLERDIGEEHTAVWHRVYRGQEMSAAEKGRLAREEEKLGKMGREGVVVWREERWKIENKRILGTRASGVVGECE